MAHAALDPSHARLRGRVMFRGFVVALAFATLCIFIRSVYRVAELSEGWEGALIKNQYTFVGQEGVMVIVAVLALNAFHLGFCFREGYIRKQKSGSNNAKGRTFWRRRGQKGNEVKKKDSPIQDESGSEKS